MASREIGMVIRQAVIPALLLLFLLPPLTSGESEGPCIEGLDKALKAVEERRRELDRMEEDLRIRELRLEDLRREMEGKMARLEKERERLEAILAEIKGAREEGMVELAKIYGNMPPEEAAARLERMDEELAIALIRSMNPRIAGRIMALVEPSKAAGLTERIGERFLAGRE